MGLNLGLGVSGVLTPGSYYGPPPDLHLSPDASDSWEGTGTEDPGGGEGQSRDVSDFAGDPDPSVLETSLRETGLRSGRRKGRTRVRPVGEEVP